ncbi:MAG: hypothetical protein IJY79_09270 [Clostridia bacterium]|nr:hypothetical protein [Clostridia bacterium]MBQ8741721.1 hypothetical protein [Clostridia bacterium]
MKEPFFTITLIITSLTLIVMTYQYFDYIIKLYRRKRAKKNYKMYKR